LQLLIHDPWFGWLRPLSELVVQIDERLDADEPTRASEAKALIDQVKSLLRPSEGGDVFQENYHAALQQTPDVVIAHHEVSVLLQGTGSVEMTTAPPSGEHLAGSVESNAGDEAHAHGSIVNMGLCASDFGVLEALPTGTAACERPRQKLLLTKAR
jgi:hypothetical protein